MKPLIVALILLPSFAVAQIELSLGTGIGSYNMKQMRQHQKEISNSFPVDAAFIDEFPPFLFHELSFTMPFPKALRAGLVIGYMSTGGRLHYADYSGEITCNQLMQGIYFVPELQFVLNKNTDNRLLTLSLRPGVVMTSYDLDIDAVVGSASEHSSARFNSANISAEAGMGYSRRIYRSLHANLYAGYNLNPYKGKLNVDDGSERYLTDGNGDIVTADWSGFRVSIGIRVDFDF